ncbi:CBS domain-containing protein [Brevibacillus composti]|uniref:CBS domain-containing protein n=1 Tax=Brevibacillus composti TaxID=2796470 RepID=A0A7T5EJ83_9BACL|nr:DRTGG domain-containing protein [Brevibacillus composti]QQE73550.1 CBS domain-containing protein [Brevibacillus composti]QUO40632.1 CBS domain-containing protein [Brevibacillus composti]
MATKHEQILQYIDKLPIGSKISVRQIAKDLDVSEGTAYRAIKEAETQGYVSTIERVGTVRIEKKQKENIERLTFAEVVNIVDGHVLGGREGLHKTLNKFVIGAMQLEAMMRYIDAGSLLLVGNRFQAHKIALQQGAAVLITGGFDTSEEVKQLADRLALPIISSSYDTFTVASMINRAIYDRLIKKEIVMVEDILKPLAETPVLLPSDPVAKWHQYTELYHDTRFPVVDEQMRLIGIVTSKDIIGHEETATVEKVMTKNPITTSPRVSVASSAHTMVWEGIELLPVVDNQRKLVGVLSRNDVLKALQYTAKQPQMSETFPNLIMSHFREERQGDELVYTGEVTPQMTNHLGTIASGIMTTVMAEAGCNLLRNHRRADMVPENITVYFLKPVQMESKIQVRPRLLDISRRFGKVEVSVYQGDVLVGQAMVSAQIIDR